MSSNAADGGEAVQPETPADSTQSKFLPWAKKHQDLIALLFLTVLALIPRLYRLSSAPPGLNADELFNAVDAISLGPGNWQIYFEGNFGRESLFLYLMAIPLKLFGQEIWALRLPAVLLGTGTVLLAYLIGKQAFNRRIGFIAGALIAVSLWPIMQSRWGLRAVSLTFFTALTVYLYGRLLNHEGRGIGGWLAAGFALGLTMYTYIPARLFPLVIAGWLLWLSILDTGWLRRQWPKIVLSLGVALLVFAPFGLYMIRYPDKFDQRVSGLWETVENKLEGDPDSLLERVVSVPLMFTFQGDTEGRYHVPERPVFDPLTSLFFYLGVGVSLWLAFRKGGDPTLRAGYGLLPLWTLVMLAPNFITGANTSFLRGAGAIVPIYLLTAIGVDFVYTSLLRHWPERSVLWRWSLAGFVALGLLVTLVDSWRTYFETWINNPTAREAWHADLGLIGRYLDQNPPAKGEQIFIAYDYVLDASPQVFAYNSDEAATWFDYQNTFAWRPGATKGLYITSVDKLVDALALERLASQAEIEEVAFENGDPALTVYRVDPEDIDWSPENSHVLDFQDGPRLIGYDILDTLFRGDTVNLSLHWEVPGDRQGLPNRLAFIQARLEDASGNVWSQAENLLGYPQSGWQEGDRFVQFLDLEIPDGMPPGPAFFGFGIRDWESGPYRVQTSPAGGPDTASPLAGPLIVRSKPVSDFVLDADAVVFDDSLALLGSSFSTLIAPGLPLDLSLDWLALEDLAEDYQVQLQITGPDSSVVVHEQRFPMWPGTYPPSEWGAGERVTTFHRMEVPVDIETIDNPNLRVQILKPGESNSVSMTQGANTLAQMTWSLREHDFELPQITHPVSARFGESIELIGYDLDESDSQPGGELRLTLYWRALDTPSDGYTVFNHLVGSDGQFQGQLDSPPIGEAWLTASWLPGEVIVDERIIPIHPDAPGGLTRLVVGLYTAGDLVRLPVYLDGTPQQGDQLELTEVLVRP